MDLLELSESKLKKLKLKELKKLIEEQKLFEIKKSYKKKDLLLKINEVKKEYEDSDSEDTQVEELVENITELKISNKFEKKDMNKNYVIFSSNILFDLCQTLKELVDHCLIIFDKDGFKINLVDKCLVTLTNININNCYDSCNFLEDECKVVIDVNELLKILDCKENDQNMKIIFTEDFLEIYFYSTDKNFDKFKLNLLDENLVEELNNFDISFGNKINIKSRYLNKVCSKIKKFDNKIRLCIENNNLKLSSENNKIEINNTLCENQSDLNILLLLKYIIIFCKTEKFSDDLEIHYLDDNSPIKFLYKDNLSSIEFIITPQSEDYDD